MELKEKINKLVSLCQDIKVLYVEDEADVRENTYQLLHNVFSSIDVATNGQEGLEKFEIQKYDLIISDILMPLCNGIKMLTKVKELDANQPVIITSACDETKYHEQLETIGITDFVTKPLDINSLVDKLYSVVSNIKSNSL